MKSSVRDFLHSSRAWLTVPLGFSAGSGITFFSLLIWQEHVLGSLDKGLTFPTLKVAFWIGLVCGLIVMVVVALISQSQRQRSV